MSVLVALKDKERIIVGVDTRMSCSDFFKDSYKSRPKAFHIDNKHQAIVGAVGNAGLADVFENIMLKHKDHWDKIDRKYISAHIIPELVVTTYDLHYDGPKGNGMDGEVFFAYKNKAFVISGNFVISELDKYDAIGAGGPTAIASLYTSSSYAVNPEIRVAKAIEASGFVINSVSQYAFIGDTNGKQFKPVNIPFVKS